MASYDVLAEVKLPALARRVLDGLARTRPLDELCAELAIPPSKGEQIVAKLGRLGLLPQAEPSHPFSEDEEAFFASEVQVDPFEDEEPAGLWARARWLVYG